MTYSAAPKRWDHAHKLGDTYQPALITLSNAGVPYDITGATGVVQIRTEPGGALALAPTWSIVGSAANGQFTWISTAAAAQAALAVGTYRYAVRITFSDGSVRTVLEGLLSVLASVIP